MPGLPVPGVLAPGAAGSSAPVTGPAAVPAALDPALVAARAEQAERILARRRLITFTRRLNPRYHAGWVHHDIARRLEKFSDDVEKGLSPRLMLLMPPRHGKSELASRMFPAWHLGRYPDHEIIASSYNVSLAMDFSRKVKEALHDPAYQTVFDTRLHPDFQSAEAWAVQGHRGGYVAAGVGGGITGKGAHVLIIDDPIKNAEEADSADIRQKLWDWYGSTAYTRLAPGGGVLVIQTWWHDDDLAGRIQMAMQADPESDQFEVVRYPAIADHDEYLDEETDQIVYDQCPAKGRMLRRKGDALHPERYDTKKLRRIKATLQPRHWSALYQQNPVPDDGAYFTKDMFRRMETPHVKRTKVFMAWDFAITEKKQSDYTVGAVLLQDEEDILHVAHVTRFKTQDSHKLVNAIIDTYLRWSAGAQSTVLGFEDGQIYKAISSLLHKRMRERRVFPSMKVLSPITDKMARARPLQGRMQAGALVFDDKGDWYETVRAEMLRFPAGVHDDCVDGLAWATQLAIGSMPPRKAKPQEVKSWRSRIPEMTQGVGATHMAA